MKQIYDVRQTIQLKGCSEACHTSIWRHLRLLDPETVKNEVIEVLSFTGLLRLVEEGKILNATVGKTFFSKRPKVHIHYELNGHCVMTSKTFKPFILRNTCVPQTHITLKEIFNSLSAEETCEYLRDRNVNLGLDSLANL